MSMILNLCHNCGEPVDAGDDSCVNCTVPKDLDKNGWITALLTDSEGERLQRARPGLMMDYVT